MEERKENFLSSILKGIFFALIITFVGILIFAFIIKIASLTNNVIKAVNQFIKVLSIFFACTLSLRERHGLIKGAIIGIGATILTYLLFSLVLGQMDFGFSFFVDIIFMTIIGAISGIISVNLKNR